MVAPAQPDLLRDDPNRLAHSWRIAAETSRQQFPDDTKRYDYYIQQAESLERKENKT